jgi:LuxR family maltose regulon positive regulatory protein
MNGQAMLETLERNNLFIFPLDNRRQWYRYHHLFAELLRHRLRQQVVAQDLFILHGRAAEWCEVNGLTADAIDHALKAQDLERAVRLIEQNALETLRRNEIETLLKWLQALPQDVVHSRPFLCIARAWVAVATAQFDEAENWAQAAEAALAQGEWQRDYLDERGLTYRWMLGNVDAIRSTVTNGPDCIPLAQRALENLPAADVLLRGVVLQNMGEAYARLGDVTAARQAFSDAIAFNKAGGNIISTLSAMSGLAALHIRLGDLHGAADVCRQTAQLGAEEGQPGGYPVPAAGNAHRILAECFYEWNDLGAALFHATKAVEYCKRWGHFINLADSYLALARVQQARGDVPGARQTMAAVGQLVENATARVRHAAMPALERDVGHVGYLIEVTQAHLWLMQGDLDAAARWVDRWIETHDVSEDDALPYLVRPRLLIARRRYDEALRLLELALQRAEAHQRMSDAIHILNQQVCALHARGESAQALASLERVLRMAEPGGYVRTFVALQPSVEMLLRRVCSSAAAAPDYVGRILAALHAEAERAAAAPLLEPLSDREMEVLCLIAAHLSNQEIADTLVVSLNTVKTHVRRLYGKLNVGSRLAAVERARELGLL